MPVGKYVPNFITKPFNVTREYAQVIYDQTSSPKLDKWASVENRQKLAYVILVELFACLLDPNSRSFVHYLRLRTPC